MEEDILMNGIIGHAKRFPMMSEFQVIIVKEAQDLARQIDQLVPYIENPQTSTILVLNYKYKKLDKQRTIQSIEKTKCNYY